MATVPAPTQSQMSDTSLKTHNDTNIPHGTDGSAQCQIDCDIPMQRVPLNDELPYDNDITMMDATNTPIHTMNAKHTQQTQQSNWIDANDVHNKENTKHRTTAATDLDRLIQKSDVQVYDEYEKPSSQKVAANKSSDESNIDVNGIDANILSTDDIDMNGDETDECEQQHNGSEALARRTRARSESPEPCENPRTRNLQMRRQSQPVSESHENDVDEHSSQCDTSARVLHAPLKRGKSLSPPQQARRQQLVASTNLGRYSSYRYVRPLSVARKQKILFRARLARSSPPTAEQSPVKSPKMTVKVEATETKTEEVNDDEDSEYSSLEDYDDSLEPHSSDEDDFSDVDEESRNDNKALYNSTNGFTMVQCSANSIMLADSVAGKAVPSGPLAPSLFPNVPPYITFVSHEDKSVVMPEAIKKVLKWRLTTITPIVIRKIILNSGFRLLKQTEEWVGTWGKHMKSPCFRTLRSYQKLNHIPGSFQIGRKDRIWRNLQVKVQQHGQREFSFMPQTYILPQDIRRLKRLWPRFADRNTKWIIKPPASARGTGIKVVSQWKQIPKRKAVIAQKYVDRPLLINGSKFDLRLYLLVTSINPLRAYMHTDGLARFASVKYSTDDKTLSDRYMHLTNYSINKLSENYTKNEDADSCSGHKWTLKTLWKYFQGQGINTDGLWAALRNLVLRTVLTGEHVINQMSKVNVSSKYNTFELFGIDVILDSELKPWLLEVNISPSLHSSSPLDLHVKSPLVTALLNTALYQVPPKFTSVQQSELMSELGLQGAHLCHDRRMYVTHLSNAERHKHNEFTQRTVSSREHYLNHILEHLTPDDVRCLVTTEDELARCAPLERICPTPNSHRYLKFTEHSRYYNRLLDAWETRYSDDREEGIRHLRTYCADRKHLMVTRVPKHQIGKLITMTNDTKSTDTDELEEGSDADAQDTPHNHTNGNAVANGVVEAKDTDNKTSNKCKEAENHNVEPVIDSKEILVTSA